MSARRGALAAATLALAACSGAETDGAGARGGGAGEPAAEPAPKPAIDTPLLFEDRTAASGIRFRHETGGAGAKLLPETMGAGAALLDADGDGALDLFLVNGGWLAGRRPPGAADPTSALWRGRGDGTFEDASRASGADVALYGMGASAADADGDGDPDLHVTALGDNLFLANEGGRFRDATAAAGLAGGRWRDRDGREHPEWSTAAAWLDAEGDGDLDLFVANYVEWTPETEIFTTLDGTTKAFTTPDRYTGLPCRLYRNDGAGVFAEAAGALGDERGKALGASTWDFDGNGLTDVVVANDTRPNFLFLNRGGGRFEEVGTELGIAYDEDGRARAGMGIDVAVRAEDGAPAVAIGNFSSEPMSLYRWEEGRFRSVAASVGLAGPTNRPLTFGLAFADLDLDGRLDLALVNGHIEPDIARYAPAETHAQSPQVFLGLADGRFREASGEVGPDFARPRVGRGLALGDVDGDGDVDLLITTNGGSPALLANRVRERAAPHFLRVRLVGRGTNTDAIGAAVTLCAGGREQTRRVQGGGSYLSQSERALTFGLGSAERVDGLRVTWPDGRASEHAVGAVDRTLSIEEP